MLLLFSPYSFLFFSCYIIFLISLFTVSSFYYYWVVIELMMLLFIGVAYTMVTSSYSQVITYFLIQVLSSFLLLIFYTYSMPFLLTLAVLLNLSIFPFFMWYINLLYSFPNFMMWLASSLHKIPAILMINVFTLPLDITVVWLSIVFTTLISGLIILSLIDLRILLVVSSIGNNSWFILSQIANMFVFSLFIFVYSASLFIVLKSFGSLSKPSPHSCLSPTPYSLSFWVLSLSGIPPFPLFYANILVILSLLSEPGLNYCFILFILFSSLIVAGYIQSVINHFILVYSTQLHYFLNY